MERPMKPVRLSTKAEDIALARDTRVSRNHHIAAISFGGASKRTDVVYEASDAQPALSMHEVFYNDSGKPVRIHTVRYRNRFRRAGR